MVLDRFCRPYRCEVVFDHAVSLWHIGRRISHAAGYHWGMNNIKTAGLLAFMTMLLVLIADQAGLGLGFALGFAAIFNLGAYFFSDKLAIRASRAKPVTEEQLPQVYNIMRRLTQQANMPMPRIYLIESPQPNAFATGSEPQARCRGGDLGDHGASYGAGTRGCARPRTRSRSES